MLSSGVKVSGLVVVKVVVIVVGMVCIRCVSRCWFEVCFSGM